MDLKVVITRPAIKDLEEITAQLAKDDPANAESYGNLLIEKALSLSKFPKIGRRIPEYNDETCREISYPPYRIVYRLRESTRQIHIVRFWHAARGWPPL